MPSPDEIRQAFAEDLKRLVCPHCQELYTDGAVLWTEGWLRGRKDALSELGRSERDRKLKLRCESCGGLAMSNAFLKPAVGLREED